MVEIGGEQKEIDLLSLNVGDIFYIPSPYDDYKPGIEVVASDYINVKGYKRKRITLHHIDSYSNDRFYYVEGIGLNDGRQLDISWTSEYLEFHSVYDADGECIFTLDDFTAQSAGIENVGVDSLPEDDGKVYDLSGKEVANPRKGAIYIKNRVKFIQE